MLNCVVGVFLEDSSQVLVVAAVTALGEVGRNGVLLIPSEGEGFTKLSLVDNLLARLRSGKESTKVRQISLLPFLSLEHFLIYHLSSFAFLYLVAQLCRMFHGNI